MNLAFFHQVRLSILALALGLSITALAAEGNESMNVSIRIKNLSGTKEASVVFIPNMISFAVQISNETLMKYGCEFKSSDPLKIASLVN